MGSIHDLLVLKMRITPCHMQKLLPLLERLEESEILLNGSMMEREGVKFKKISKICKNSNKPKN